MLTRVRASRSGRPSEKHAVVIRPPDRPGHASSVPSSRTAPRRHVGSDTKRGNGDGRVTTYPRGATRAADPCPSRSEAQANDQLGRGTSSASVFVLNQQSQPLMPCHPARADFVPFVKRKDDVGPAGPLENFMRASRAFDLPTNAEKRGENAGGLGRRPAAHAAMNETFSSSSGTASLCSRRSAIARRARA